MQAVDACRGHEGAMYDTTQFRKGLKIEIDDVPWIMVDFQHVKPGKGSAIVRTRLKNLVSGQVVDRTFRSGDKVGVPDLEEFSATFLYHDGDMYHFMNQDTFEQIALDEGAVSDAKNFLVEQLPVSLLMFRGRAIGIDLPNFIVAEITYCEPGVAGNTAQGATKPVTISTGYVVNVPLYINENDKLKIDTRDGSYVERVKD
jgi:elongation factor P